MIAFAGILPSLAQSDVVINEDIITGYFNASIADDNGNGSFENPYKYPDAKTAFADAAEKLKKLI